MKIKWIGFYLSLSSLSACEMNTPASFNPNYHSPEAQGAAYLVQGYSDDDGTYSNFTDAPEDQITARDEAKAYAAKRSPLSAKERDKTWAKKQNPEAYTIEVADGTHPAEVAKKLAQLPKQNSMAELKYQGWGQAHYKGLYGSYATKEAAEEARKTLPPELQEGAKIKNWAELQKNLND